MKPNCANWKATKTPKPVTLVVEASQSSDGGLECGKGSDGAFDTL